MATLRGYLTIEELESKLNITVSDQDEAWEQIDFAEELIDRYVGPQDQHIRGDQMFLGAIVSVSGTTVIDDSADTPLSIGTEGYFSGSVIEILAGPGVGERRRITDSQNGQVTIESAFTTTPTSASVYWIHQLAKFPRKKDMVYHEDKYYRTIPEVLKNAVAAQVGYMIEQGDSFFSGDGADLDSERIGNYSYSKGGGGSQSASVRLVAPKARTILRGIMNRKGVLEV